MCNTLFRFFVKEIAVGWCDVEMIINDKVINFDASYVGPNPLDSLIEACADLSGPYSDGEFYVTWLKEPGSLHIALKLEDNKLLDLDIKLCSEESGNDVIQEWHETIPYDIFESAVVSEGFRILKMYGLCGYHSSWSKNIDFPLSALLRLTKKVALSQKGDSFYSDINTELECLSHYLPINPYN